ncbi:MULTISPECIES: segregation and condensation protein A [unclassified Knoellia]|uniref:segregation and condensation protein A n=1 Tax=Knoellia altitudinis TaxID=3404795 RepID=UPI00360F652F
MTEAPGGVLTRRAATTAFEVHLDVFSGPFDLLLGLISKHKLDITEIAIAQVTDEFIAHIKTEQAKGGDVWDLSQASEFLLVAATLLDIKAARLLPQAGPEDEEDLALIEARDLLFARLLQYRAFKDIARTFDERMTTAGRMTARQAGIEPQFAKLLPELVMTITPDQLAMIAAHALTPKVPDVVGLGHLHAPAVSVREQASIIGERLRREGVSSFRSLVRDADNTLVIVARFLALLELFRESSISFEQAEALGELTVRWTGPMEGDIEVTDEFDETETGIDEPRAVQDALPAPATPDDQDASTDQREADHD